MRLVMKLPFGDLSQLRSHCCHSQKTAPRACEIKAVFSGISAELGRRPQTANIVSKEAGLRNGTHMCCTAWAVLDQLPFEVKCIFSLDIYCVGTLDGF